MEALFIFIAKSSGLIVLFYFAYFLLLRKETFFNSNRWFLLLGLVTSVLLPLLVYTKIVWVDPAPIQNISYSSAYLPNTIALEETFEINWNLVLIAVYIIGFSAFLIKFALDFYSLSSVLKGQKVQQQADFKFIDINENIAPFSYFDYIVYNSSMYSATELENIIEHEKVHSDQNHTIDVLISRLFCILFWFNPIIWFYKKAIIQNLEFIADCEAAKKLSDKKAYQYTLLKITTHESCVSITNHFYQSLIKKRIVMLNKNQSKKRNYWKYYAIVPALVVFVVLFQIKTIAQEKKQSQKEIAKKDIKLKEIYKIHKNSSDQDLAAIVEKLKADHNIDAVISDVKRNAANELISIKVAIKKDDNEAQTIQVEGNEAIKDCGIVITTEDDGSKNINLTTDGGPREPKEPMVMENHRIIVRDVQAEDQEDPTASPVPPTPPTPPAFPSGALPAPPAMNRSKMPKPPVVPANPKDKTAMKNFEKEMSEFEKKMKAYEPDMTAYEKQVDEIMSQREIVYGEEMKKYELAMDKYSADMEKYSQDTYQKSGDTREYEKNMRRYQIDMKLREKEMKQYEKEMKQHEKEMKQHQKEIILYQKETRRS
ncbi:M56 family metallopeptidase [Flavobacterium sp. MC2016-06]|uniref:M56 family metallopeptidase n=1 Tax=Flavobacterium sp. MC2016-06 TaxID=2676308 RepID=UPI0012BA9B4C|nr:M56 family metallopeptidase [Flavobacterium sp. MC2016-06]MBU3862462.1 peptidase M56 [Flavobacterium sp. MC2016-06]